MLKKLKTVYTKVVSQFKPRPAVKIGENLYAACVSQSRRVPFYLELGVRDEIGARFELLCLHVILVLQGLQLKSDRPEYEQAKETAQGLFDALLRGLDDTLREQGVGDLSVAKKMKKLGQVVYARIKAWDEMEQAGAVTMVRADYLLKTVYAAAENEDVIADAPQKAAQLALYTEKARNTLALSRVLHGQTDWPELN